MKRFMPLIKIAVGAGVGMLALKANTKLGIAIDQDALTAAIMAALAAANTRNQSDRPPRQDPPKD